MKKMVAAFMVLLVMNSALAAGYKDDNVRWLVYDMKTKDKTLMDIRMDTYLFGQATFTGPKSRIGRRKMGVYGRFKVEVKNEAISVLDGDGGSIMWGKIDRDRGEIKGEFSEKYGGGSWVASMQGFPGEPVDLYQYCAEIQGTLNVYDWPNEWSCPNVGVGQSCEVGWYSAPVGSFNKEGCLEVAQQHCETAQMPFTDFVWNDAKKKCERQ